MNSYGIVLSLEFKIVKLSVKLQMAENLTFGELYV